MQVSELVFGGGWVGGLLIHQDDATKLQAVRHALDAGINFIDTAASYGDGKSEQALGWLLKEVDQNPYLATKFRLDLGDGDDIKGQIEASVEASLKRLRRDSVDLIQLHNRIGPEGDGDIVSIDQVLGDGGVADVLDSLRQGGLTRYIGITGLGAPAAVRQVIESGRFDSAQIYYNLLNPSAGRAMPETWSGHDFGQVIEACKAQDVAVMNIRVLASGALATDERHGREVQIIPNADLPLEARRAGAVFDKLGQRFGTRAQTALRFSLANPDLACIVVGMAELDHLEQALAAAEMGPMPQDGQDEIAMLHAANFGLS
ncbi:MAG: aldo/keto reductase [Alphaproteobacteria bacterium]|nr:aldo/keto reductase [Alphaproteobacteria bacterium]